MGSKIKHCILKNQLSNEQLSEHGRLRDQSSRVNEKAREPSVFDRNRR